MEEKLLAEFGQMYPGYHLEPAGDGGFKLIRDAAIRTEDGLEGVWIATIYEMPEFFVLMEYNRKIVNERVKAQDPANQGDRHE